MTKLQYYFLWLFMFAASFALVELVWIGAKFIFEGSVVHTYLDHCVAVCGALYLARDGVQIRMRLHQKASKR